MSMLVDIIQVCCLGRDDVRLYVHLVTLTLTLYVRLYLKCPFPVSQLDVRLTFCLYPPPGSIAAPRCISSTPPHTHAHTKNSHYLGLIFLPFAPWLHLS
jgi:hypothetical protein